MKRASKTTTAPDGHQRDRFIEAAKALGADDDEATFKAKLGVIAKAKPEPAKAKFK